MKWEGMAGPLDDAHKGERIGRNAGLPAAGREGEASS